MAIDTVPALAKPETDGELTVVICMSLLGLMISLMVLDLIGSDFAMALVFAG
jgi:hypothetical protein